VKVKTDGTRSLLLVEAIMCLANEMDL